MVYFVVGLGGALGTIMRYFVDYLLSRTFLPPSSGILMVNLLGCFMIGFFLSLNSERFSPLVRIGFATGFIGSFTTFSTFSVKVWELFINWGVQTSAIYTLLTIIGGYCFVHLGHSFALKIEKG
ncbi:camphor resistance protein CrcB [Neobacillus bataviensis LMG 21833]|uniref:Fluoride-specific ion channel FluC n=1 Tax=Neobacillus bataviensis LMG 21833 TaxID=1117379 RepID=K6D2H7_9BACI|nr:CrcB family protein [Neobacillus bataviensis]EKN66697.1 camphor resistance protein CrcB [Neobacillus bataviensis LMG 21833]